MMPELLKLTAGKGQDGASWAPREAYWKWPAGSSGPWK